MIKEQKAEWMSDLCMPSLFLRENCEPESTVEEKQQLVISIPAPAEEQRGNLADVLLASHSL